MDDPMEHLDYEVEMLVETYKRAATETERIARNAYIESFCTHARLLFELFEKEHKNPKFSSGYVPARDPTYYNNILNNQISHLARALRTHDDGKKIDHAMRTDMLDRLRDELTLFKGCMLDKTKAAAVRSIPAMSISVTSSPPSATNAVQTSTIGSTTTSTPTVTGTVQHKP
jgi:hypothetical protein